MVAVVVGSRVSISHPPSICRMKPSALARRAAPRTSASGAPGLAYAMFSATVPGSSNELSAPYASVASALGDRRGEWMSFFFEARGVMVMEKEL